MPGRPRYDDEYDDDRGGYAEPHRGTLILVLGLLGLLVCGLLAPFAWVMGSTDLKKMAAGRMDPSGQSHTQAGYVCGIIGTILLVLSVVALLVVGVFFLAFAGAAAR
jgi:hypothetical protein